MIRFEKGDKERAERANVVSEVEQAIISDGAVTSTGAGQECLAILKVSSSST